MTANYTNWETEFVDAKFVDRRLKTRFFKIMDAFAAAPDKSTWMAAGSRSSAKAAYRFFNNTDVSRDELLDSVSRATVEKNETCGCRVDPGSPGYHICWIWKPKSNKRNGILLQY